MHFRVWAPKRRRVDVAIEGHGFALAPEPGGYFSGLVEPAREGTRYGFKLDGGQLRPDPASRYQPDGPHGMSQVIDPFRFQWQDGDWRGVDAGRQVIYEMHVGTFTRAGTFAAAAKELPRLAELGVTTIEVLPLAEFPGRFGWGYDGVDLFAPFHGYGTCDDFRAFVNRAHAEGIAVILDVVYNHFGPDGNYLREFSDAYFTADHVTDWGEAINYDGDDSGPVRELAISNARYWISEYHLDGLRLDATDNIYDDSRPHLIEEIGRAAREEAGDRRIVLVAENEQQRSRLMRRRDEGGYGLDLMWNDDFHHSAVVAATGKREAYYTDYRGAPQELLSAVKHGFLYQGQNYSWQKQRRGTAALDIPLHKFVHFIENHDQVANSGDGRRLHQLTSPGRYRALVALMMLGPQTPMIFQGQEFGSSAPFLYFADHNPELAKLVLEGRGKFLAQFPSLADEQTQRSLPDPADVACFERSRLDPDERVTAAGREHWALHRDLIALRQCDPVLAREPRVDGAVLGSGDRGGAFVVRFFGSEGNDRLLVVNLGPYLALGIAPEPLLAPRDRDRGWDQLWQSEDRRYGGVGVSRLESEVGSWRIPAESATLLASDDE